MTNKYDVGYGKPPKKTQFKKGKSGNPQGRKKKSVNTINLIENELIKEMQVKEGGKTLILTQQQIIIRQLFKKAIQGDFKASVLVLEFMKEVEKYREEANVVFEGLKGQDLEILKNHEARILNKANNKEQSND